MTTPFVDPWPSLDVVVLAPLLINISPPFTILSLRFFFVGLWPILGFAKFTITSFGGKSLFIS